MHNCEPILTITSPYMEKNHEYHLKIPWTFLRNERKSRLEIDELLKCKYKISHVVILYTDILIRFICNVMGNWSI